MRTDFLLLIPTPNFLEYQPSDSPKQDKAQKAKTDEYARTIQTNKNLLLSSEARANSNPELKIYANDVKCKHGATIGQLDAAQVFYLRSRGVPLVEARKLLVSAFASEMIHFVEDEALRATLQKYLHV